MLGAVSAVTLRGMPNDVYFTVGLITVIGLAAKDGIPIIEFARGLRTQGTLLVQATIEACRMRFRPILMTGLAFACGVGPMALACGASAKGQQALATGVLGGMIAVVVPALIMVPVFFVVVQRWCGRSKRDTAHDSCAASAGGDAAELRSYAAIGERFGRRQPHARERAHATV